MNQIEVWDLKTGRLLSILEGILEANFSIAITSDNSKIVSGSWGAIRVWDLNRGELLNTLKTGIWVYSVAISSDNSKIVSGTADKTIKVWDLKSGELLNNLGG